MPHGKTSLRRVITGLVIALTAASCGSTGLTPSEAESLVRSELTNPVVMCLWEGQVDRMDDQHGRWSNRGHTTAGEVFYDSALDRDACLGAMQAGGVIGAPDDQGVFLLRSGVRFNSEGDVLIPCHTGRIDRVRLRPGQDTAAIADVHVKAVRELRGRHVFRADAGSCRGSIRGVGTCVAHFRRKGGWHLEHINDGPGCETRSAI